MTIKKNSKLAKLIGSVCARHQMGSIYIDKKMKNIEFLDELIEEISNEMLYPMHNSIQYNHKKPFMPYSEYIKALWVAGCALKSKERIEKRIINV